MTHLSRQSAEHARSVFTDAAKSTAQRKAKSLPPFSLRLNAEERQRLEVAAAGVPLGSYIKARLFDGDLSPRRTRGQAPVKDHAALAQVLGMLGNMRLANGGKASALLVPDAAIQSDQARKTVLVVGKDDSVAAKPVELGPVVDGLRIIRSGLDPQDRVVITNVEAAMPGAKVATRPATIRPAPPPVTPVDSVAPAAAQATFAR